MQGAAYGWHTVAPPTHSSDGKAQWHLGRHAFVVQLNSAGRALAASLSMLLIDYAAMVEGFSDHSYMLDRHHPSHAIQLEVANIYLNLLHQLPKQPHCGVTGLCQNSG